MIKIEHHSEECIGCHYCVDILPTYYQMDYNEGRAVLIGANGNPPSLLLPDTELNVFRHASLVCPTAVIQIKKV